MQTPIIIKEWLIIIFEIKLIDDIKSQITSNISKPNFITRPFYTIAVFDKKNPRFIDA